MEDSEIYNRISRLNNELVNAQRNIVKANKQLEYQMETFSTTIQNISDPVIVVDNHFDIVLLNQNSISFANVEPGYEGKAIDAVFSFFDMQDNNIPQKFSVSEQKSIFPLQNKELAFLRNNSESIFVEISVSPIKDNTGNSNGYVVVIHSIDERKKIESKQVEIKNFLQIINRILRHDILNHLSVIQMATDISIERKEFTFLEDSKKSIQSSVKLISDMKNMEIAFSEGGNLKLYPSRAIVEDVASNYSIQFEISGDGEILADEAFFSVIDNIVRNAINHGKAKKMDITITPKEDYCEFCFKDYGVGVDNSVIEKLFEEDFKYGSTGNTGLGLYIVKKVIERYGGEVWVESEKGKGTTFKFTIPIHA